jgi:hypothetical protein
VTENALNTERRYATTFQSSNRTAMLCNLAIAVTLSA